MNNLIFNPVLLKKHENGIEIYFEAYQDTFDPQHLEEQDAHDILERSYSGKLELFTACVFACKNGIRLAETYLGQCIYASFEDFYEAKGDYCESMQLEVLNQALEEIASLTEGIKNITDAEFFPTNLTQPFGCLEVHPCMYIDDTKAEVEQCEPSEAHFWSVYVHLVEGGLYCIADCPSEDAANSLKDLIEAAIKYHVKQD